ncbi:MAG: phosphate propanoyltransferase [Bacilli bacterium]|nr:phosphate propanoyltransferase [Bacilli bacterium]
MKIKIGVSARHVHLSLDDFKILFGSNHKLTKINDLIQPGEFAAAEMVTIKTEKGQIENVRIIGPIRPYTQVEISKTDAYVLGLNPPVRNSGDLIGSEPITIMTDKGVINKPYGCIIATRHIHIAPDLIKKYKINADKKVKIKIFGEKGGIIDNVHIRVIDNAKYELHLDLDDANAHLLKNGDEGEVLLNE